VEVSVDFFGDWFFTFRTLAVTNVTKFSSDEACEYVSEGCKFFGKMTKDGNSFAFQGSTCQEEEINLDPRSNKSSVELIAIWNVSSTSIVQSTTLILDSGHSGICLRETFELDINLMYKSKHRSRIGRYIETKLPSLLVRLPFRVPAPESWCICQDDPREEDQEDHDDDGYVGEGGLEPDLRCMVHGLCDECEGPNSVCDCDWWYDQHFCSTCGLNLINCECVHISEIIEKLYDY